MKLFLPIFLTLGLLHSMYAQQLPLVAQHPEFHGLINPASINIDYLLDARTVTFGASWRQQWVQLGELSPVTQVLRGETVLNPNDNNSWVVGGYVIRDKVGITNNLGVYGRAAYVVKTNGQNMEDGGISVGLNVGVANWQLRTDRLSLTHPDDPNLVNRPSSWYPDLGFGAYWYVNLGAPSHYLYLGLSSPRTFEFRSNDLGARRLPHYYGLLGYYVPLPSSDNGYVEISTWSRYVENVRLQTSFHCKVQPMDYFWVGAGVVTDFKPQPLLLVEAGLNIPTEFRTFKLGYSYTWGNFLSHFGATHEFNVAFALDTQ